MNGLTLPATILRNNIARITLLFLVAVVLILSPTRAVCQEVDSHTLTRILVKMDSLHKDLIYSGVLEMERLSPKRYFERMRIWKNRDEFYHKTLMSTKAEAPLSARGQKSRKYRRHRFSRRSYAEFSMMPNKKYLELLLKNYHVALEPGDIIAGHATRFLRIQPVHQPRFGMNIWFDKETYHILKREIIFYHPGKADLIFHSEYKEIQYGVFPPDSLVRAERERENRSHRPRKGPKRKAYPDLNSLQDVLQHPVFIPKYIPEGCELVSIQHSVDRNRSVIQLHYTDGILSFSIFQFLGTPPKPIKRILKRVGPPANQPPEFRQVFAVEKDQTSFLLIGNFTIAQFKKVADSLTRYRE